MARGDAPGGKRDGAGRPSKESIAEEARARSGYKERDTQSAARDRKRQLAAGIPDNPFLLPKPKRHKGDSQDLSGSTGPTQTPLGTTTQTPLGTTSTHTPPGTTSTHIPLGTTSTHTPLGTTITHTPPGNTPTHTPLRNTTTQTSLGTTTTHTSVGTTSTQTLAGGIDITDDSLAEESGPSPDAEEEEDELPDAVKDVEEGWRKMWVDYKMGGLTAQMGAYKGALPEIYQKGDVFIRPDDPDFVFFRPEAYSEEIYGPDVVVNDARLFCQSVIMAWIPHLLPRAPKHFICPDCKGSGDLLSNNGWNKVYGRRVRGLTEDFTFCTPRYRHRKSAKGGCGHSFQGSHPGILAQLPISIQRKFQIIFTKKGAVTVELMNQLRTCVAGHFGFSKVADSLNEARAWRHSNDEARYLSLHLQLRNTLGQDPGPPPPFPRFDDPNTYHGKFISAQYCSAVFKAYHNRHGPIMERVIFSGSGRILQGDGSFKFLKRMYTIDGRPGAVMLFTVVNQDGEVRAMQLLQSKSNEAVGPLWEALVLGLKAHGHAATSVVYSDNAGNEAKLLEGKMASLLENVVKISPPSKHQHLPLYAPQSNVRYTSSAHVIDEFCRQIQDATPETEQVYIGFDVEWKTGRNHHGGVSTYSGDGRVDVVQIAVGADVYVFQITDYQDIRAAPTGLVALLSSSRFTKVGRNVKTDLERVAKLWDLGELERRLNGTSRSQTDYLDLGAFAKFKGRVTSAGCSLQDLSAAVLRNYLPKTDVRTSDWSLPLDEEQIEYAAKDASVSLDIYTSLSTLPSVGPINLSTPIGTLVEVMTGKSTVALGELAPRSEQKQLGLTSTRAVVKVTEVVMPGFMVKHNGKRMLSQLGPPPFLITVALASLKSRHQHPAVETIPTSSQTVPPNLPSPIVLLPADFDLPMPSSAPTAPPAAQRPRPASSSSAAGRTPPTPSSPLRALPSPLRDVSLAQSLGGTGWVDDDAELGPSSYGGVKQPGTYIDGDWDSGGSDSGGDSDSEDDDDRMSDGTLESDSEDEQEIRPRAKVLVGPTLAASVINTVRSEFQSPLSSNGFAAPPNCGTGSPSHPPSSSHPPSHPPLTSSTIIRPTSAQPGESTSQLDPNPPPSPIIQRSPAYDGTLVPDTIPTRVKDDAFHGMQRVMDCLSKSHPGFKRFARAFSASMFVVDVRDQAAVTAHVEKNGSTWERALREQHEWVNRRVRRWIPSAAELAASLRILHAGWRDVLDQDAKTPLFTPKANKAMEALIAKAELGFFSDTPGIPLYSVRKHSKRTGLTEYRCTRGTNTVEEVHKEYRRCMGSNGADMCTSVAILREVVLRRNMKVGHENRTGTPFRAHYDRALHDDIQEMADELGIRTSFARMSLLATRIHSDEVFGVGPISENDKKSFDIRPAPPVESTINPHQIISRLDTKRSSDRAFMQRLQGTAKEVAPVALKAERALYDELLSTMEYTRKPKANDSGKGKPVSRIKLAESLIDFRRLTKAWNHRVNRMLDGEKGGKVEVAYKLEEHLRSYFRIRFAVGSAKDTINSSYDKLKDYIAHVGSPGYGAITLPARPLPPVLTTTAVIATAVNARSKGNEGVNSSPAEHMSPAVVTTPVEIARPPPAVSRPNKAAPSTSTPSSKSTAPPSSSNPRPTKSLPSGSLPSKKRTIQLPSISQIPILTTSVTFRNATASTSTASLPRLPSSSNTAYYNPRLPATVDVPKALPGGRRCAACKFWYARDRCRVDPNFCDGKNGRQRCDCNHPDDPQGARK